LLDTIDKKESCSLLEEQELISKFEGFVNQNGESLEELILI
jgi:hypothetical protein